MSVHWWLECSCGERRSIESRQRAFELAPLVRVFPVMNEALMLSDDGDNSVSELFEGMQHSEAFKIWIWMGKHLEGGGSFIGQCHTVSLMNDAQGVYESVSLTELEECPDVE